MQTKLEIKAARLLSIDRRRKAHNAALSRLHADTPGKAPRTCPKCERDVSPCFTCPKCIVQTVPAWQEMEQEDHEARGLKMWRKLRRLETEAHDAATAQCNGERYGSQPFREDEQWEEFKQAIAGRVAFVFGRTHLHPPQGFFVNGDARGMALKLDPDKCTVPEGMETDWGNNGILAAEIND